MENIAFRNIRLKLDDGVKACKCEVLEKPIYDYNEAFVYGRILTAKAVIITLAQLLKGAVKTITCHRGSEFANWQK